MKKITAIFLSLIFVLSLSGCSMYKSTTTTNDRDLHSSAKRVINIAGEEFSVFCYGDNCEKAADAVIEEVERLDAVVDATKDDSEVSKLNQNKEGEISDTMYFVLQKALKYYEDTNGAYNFIYSEDNDISKIEISEKDGKYFFKMGEDQEFDLWGMAEGYVLQRSVNILKNYGIVSAEIYFEDSFAEYGNSANGEPWVYKVPKGFEDDLDTSGKIGDLKASNKIVCTTIAESPVSDLSAVTIISSDGTLADSLSIAFLRMGYDKTVEFWKQNSDKFDMILTTTDCTIFATENIRRNFTSAYYNINLITNG